MASTGRQEQRGEKAFVPHASTRSPAQHKVNLAYKIHKSRLSLSACFFSRLRCISFGMLSSCCCASFRYVTLRYLERAGRECSCGSPPRIGLCPGKGWPPQQQQASSIPPAMSDRPGSSGIGNPWRCQQTKKHQQKKQNKCLLASASFSSVS